MHHTALQSRQQCAASTRTHGTAAAQQRLLKLAKRQWQGIRANAEAGKSGSGIRTTTATPAQSDGVNPELWGLHEELLKEIEERKQYQALLLQKLDEISGAASAATASSAAPPAATPTRRPATSVPASKPAIPISRPAARPPVQPVAPPPARTTVPRTVRPAPVAAPAPTMPRTTRPAPPPPMPLPRAPKVVQPVVRAPPPVVAPPPPVVIEVEEEEALPLLALPPLDEKPPPLCGEQNVMNIVMVGAECAPWSKTGGLGDVMGALPKALAARGHRVMVVAPRYANYDDAWETGVRCTFSVFNATQEVGFFHSFKDGVDYVFVDHSCYHNRGKDIYAGERQENMFRCALLCKAALEAVWHVPCGGIVYGDQSLCFIANDWHTALLPVYLQAHYRDYDKMKFARCVFVIHNMAHQGRAPFADTSLLELNEHYRDMFMLDDPIGGEHMNIMKAGLQTAHRVVAVSHGYAWECKTQEGGWGLHTVLQEGDWKLRGIVNGIDYNEWSPMNDVFLDSDGYTRFDITTMREGKAACKAALQRELGLPVDPNIPLLGFIGRLDYQKGVDLICDNYDWLMSQNVQLVMLGSGRDDLEGMLRDMEHRNQAKCKAWVGFSVKMAHRITAGCDILLMPSRFEPCGLNQLYAMAYGTAPVVHAVGGLRDTVKPYNPFENSGTGWTFDRAESGPFREAVNNSLLTFRDYRDSFTGIQLRGMDQDLSWNNAAQQYEEVILAAKYQW